MDVVDLEVGARSVRSGPGGVTTRQTAPGDVIIWQGKKTKIATHSKMLDSCQATYDHVWWGCSVLPTWPRSSSDKSRGWLLGFFGPSFVIRKQQTSSRILIQAAELLVGQLGISNEDFPVAIIGNNGDEIARVALAFLEGRRLGNGIWEFCGAKTMLNEDCLSERLTYQIWKDRANGQTCQA